jgi:hypothetical protein
MAPVAIGSSSSATTKPALPLKAMAMPPQARDAPARTAFAFDAIEDVLAAFARGEFLVVMDDADRENEGDLIVAAHACSTEQMAWMIKHTRCVSLILFQWASQADAETVQWLYLYRAPGRAARGARDPDDGPAKRGSAPHGVHRDRRLQARWAWPLSHM